MAKLYAKERPVTVSHMEDDGYHCCRWCHWCKHVDNFDWVCTNPCYKGTFTISAAQEIENGSLSEVLEEALHSVPEGVKTFLGDLKSQLYKWNLSEKRVKEFEQVFSECLNQFLDMELKGEIDEKVSILYNHCFSEFQSEGVIIADPFTHYCREFW